MSSSFLTTDHSSYEDKQGSSNQRSTQSCSEEESYCQLAGQDYFRVLMSLNQYQQSQQSISLPPQLPDQRQGYFAQFQTDPVLFNEADSTTFNQLIHELNHNDFSHFIGRWNTNGFKEKLEFLIDQWPIYKTEYKEAMEQFLSVASRKLQNISIYDKIYPGLEATIKKLRKKLHYQPIDVNGQQIKEDFIFFHYINEQQVKAEKAGSYFFKVQKEQKQQLGQYISDNNYFQSNQQTWKLLFFLGAAIKRHDIDATRQPDTKRQCKKIYKFSQLLTKNYDLTQPVQRICCSKFFYMNFDICPTDNGNVLCRPKSNYLKNRVHKQYEWEIKRIKMQDKQDLQEFNQQMKDLMLDVVGLLNSGGGVELLFAKNHYLQTWVQGESILQQKKQIYRKLIENGLRAIRPVVRMRQEVNLTFVPVVKNPYEYDYLTDLEDEKDRSVNRNYVQGLYCPRITVVPSEAERLYYYQGSGQEVVSAIVEKNKRVTLKGETMLLWMQRKFENFYVSEAEAEDEQSRELLCKDFLRVARHRCEEPYLGHRMQMQQAREVAEPVKQFKYMSMLVAHRKNHSEIQAKLISKGVDCLIATMFDRFKLKSSGSSAPIYHNIRFDQIFSEINHNKEYEYNGRYVLIIAVTSYIKLINRSNKEPFPKANLDNLWGYLNAMYPNTDQTLTLFSFISDEKETEQYIKATTKESTLLAYYLLHDKGEKCIFKNPRSLDKIPQPQKAIRWKLLYSAGVDFK